MKNRIFRNIHAWGTGLLLLIVAPIILSMASVSAKYSFEARPSLNEFINFTLSDPVEISNQEEFVNAVSHGYNNIKIADGVGTLVSAADMLSVLNNIVIDLNGNDIVRVNTAPLLSVKEGQRVIILDSSVSEGSNNPGGSLYNPTGTVLKVDGGDIWVAGGHFESGPRKSEYLSTNNFDTLTTPQHGKIEQLARVKLTAYTYDGQASGIADEKNVSNFPIIVPSVTNGFVNGNIYLDNSVESVLDKVPSSTDSTDNSEEETQTEWGTVNNSDYFKRDTYLYFVIEDPNVQLAAAKNSTGPDFEYSYYMTKDEAGNYSYAGVTAGDANTYKVTVFGFYNDFEKASQKDSHYAAIEMQKGTIIVSNGKFTSYFGIQEETACVYASGGYICIYGGDFRALNEGECIQCDYMAADNEKEYIQIEGGSFLAYFGETVLVDNGKLLVHGGTFKKDTTKRYEIDHALPEFDPLWSNEHWTTWKSNHPGKDPWDCVEEPDAIGDFGATLLLRGGKAIVDGNSASNPVEFILSGSGIAGVRMRIESAVPIDKPDYYNLEIRNAKFWNGNPVESDSTAGLKKKNSNGELDLAGTLKRDGFLAPWDTASGAQRNAGVYLGVGRANIVECTFEFASTMSAGVFSPETSNVTTSRQPFQTRIHGCTFKIMDVNRISYAVSMTGNPGTADYLTFTNSDLYSTGYGLYIKDATLNFGHEFKELGRGMFTNDSSSNTSSWLFCDGSGVIIDNGKLNIREKGNLNASVRLNQDFLANSYNNDIYKDRVQRNGVYVGVNNAQNSNTMGFFSTGIFRLAFRGIANPYQETELTDATGKVYTIPTQTESPFRKDWTYYYDEVSFTQAIQVNGGNFEVSKGTLNVTSYIGGGITVTNGNVVIGSDATNTFDSKEELSEKNDNDIMVRRGVIVRTLGSKHQTDWWDYMGDFVSDLWVNKKSIEGGNALKVDGGNLTVHNGIFHAEYGNGILVCPSAHSTTEKGYAAKVIIEDGIFEGYFNKLVPEYWSYGVNNGKKWIFDNKYTPAGPGAYYGLKITGECDVEINNGNFYGGNGGAFVSGIKKSVHSVVKEGEARVSFSYDGKNANVVVKQGEFGREEFYPYGNGNLGTTSLDGFNVFDAVDITFGLKTDDSDEKIHIIARNCAVVANPFTQNGINTYSKKSSVTIYSGTYIITNPIKNVFLNYHPDVETKFTIYLTGNTSTTPESSPANQGKWHGESTGNNTTGKTGSGLKFITNTGTT